MSNWEKFKPHSEKQSWLIVCLCLQLISVWFLSTGACWTTNSKATERTTERQQEQRPQTCTEG